MDQADGTFRKGGDPWNIAREERLLRWGGSSVTERKQTVNTNNLSLGGIIC